MKGVVAGVTAFLLAGCDASVAQKPVSVAEVIANIHAWNGKTAVVAGWLGNCGGNDCGLYQSLADARIVANGDADVNTRHAVMDRRLSIGSKGMFDWFVSSYQFKPVLLKARISDACRGRGFGCLDRGAELYPLSIQPDHTKKDS